MNPGSKFVKTTGVGLQDAYSLYGEIYPILFGKDVAKPILNRSNFIVSSISERAKLGPIESIMKLGIRAPPVSKAYSTSSPEV